MTSYALFLRGINVGAANRIKMADLVSRLEEAGFGSVRTYIQSGNVRMESALDADAVLGSVQEVLAGFGVRSPVLAVIPWGRLEELVALKPFDGVDLEGGKALAMFLCGARCGLPVNEMPSQDIIEFHRVEPEVLLAHFRTQDPRNFDLKKTLEKPLGVQVTVRYWSVVEEFVGRLG